MKTLDFEDYLSSKVESSVDRNGSLVITVKDIFPSKKEYENNKTKYKELWCAYIDIALSKIKSTGNEIPYFINSIVVVNIHMSAKFNTRWDVDNKAYGVIINALCGRVIYNDDCEHMGLLVLGNYDKANEYVKIHVIDWSKVVNALSPLINTELTNISFEDNS